MEHRFGFILYVNTITAIIRSMTCLFDLILTIRFFFFYTLLVVCLLTHFGTCHDSFKIGGQLAEFGLLLQICGSWNSGSVFQAWWQVPLPTELSYKADDRDPQSISEVVSSNMHLSTFNFKSWNKKNIWFLEIHFYICVNRKLCFKITSLNFILLKSSLNIIFSNKTSLRISIMQSYPDLFSFVLSI